MLGMKDLKDIVKIAIFAISVLALSPFAGFWIVGLVGGGLLLLPMVAAISKFLPKTWQHIENSLLAKTHFSPTA